MGLKDKLRGTPVLGTALTVHERYTEDLGNHLAASIAFFTVLSIFPLMLLGLSVAGYVLADDPTAQEAFLMRMARGVPGLRAALGDTLEATLDTIVDNRGVAGAVGLLGVLFAGLRVIDGAKDATSVVYRSENRANPLVKKLESLFALIVLGLLFVAGAFASGAVGLAGDAATSIGIPPEVTGVVRLTAPLVGFALDLAFFVLAYRLLSAGAGPPWRDLWAGAALAAVGWGALKTFGAAYVGSQAAQWNGLYGALGGVIALMLLLFLAGRIYVYGAELNAVRRERRTDHGTVGHEPAVEEPPDLSPWQRAG
ncbi:MAG TPA: YihY/virulence factor BrkB family protein [Nitriliruptorales bacterium]|nr:YihY/virulence factor BrkB family protein [Nitriliruptorales bacterium]